MQPLGETMPLQQRLKFVIFFIIFWVVGLVFAFWLGLGWLMLFETIQSLIFTFPRLYLSIIRVILGQEFKEKEKLRMLETGTYAVISWKLAVRTIISIGLTILFFWKVNISLLDFIKMLLK